MRERVAAISYTPHGDAAMATGWRDV